MLNSNYKSSYPFCPDIDLLHDTEAFYSLMKKSYPSEEIKEKLFNNLVEYIDKEWFGLPKLKKNCSSIISRL